MLRIRMEDVCAASGGRIGVWELKAGKRRRHVLPNELCVSVLNPAAAVFR